MKNYVTTTLSVFGYLLLNEGVELFTGVDGNVKLYRCSDKNAVTAALSALQQNISPFAVPTHAHDYKTATPVGIQQLGYMQNHIFRDIYNSQQYAISRFVCELEIDMGTGQTYVTVYDAAYPNNRATLPVIASLKKFNEYDYGAKPCSGVYKGSLSNFLNDAQTTGATLKVNETEFGLFILSNGVSVDSGIAALNAIGQAIRVTEGHHVASAPKQVIEIATESIVRYHLAYELLEGHQQLKLFFKDHPTLFVTISVRRIG